MIYTTTKFGGCMRGLAFFLLFAPCVAFASNWQVISKQDQDWTGYLPGDQVNGVLQHSTVSILIDRDSIATEGAIKRVWWKQTASANGRLMDQISLNAFDCNAHTVETLRSGDRYSAKAPYAWAKVGGGSYYIEPDDPWDHVFSAVCLNK